MLKKPYFLFRISYYFNSITHNKQKNKLYQDSEKNTNLIKTDKS